MTDGSSKMMAGGSAPPTNISKGSALLTDPIKSSRRSVGLFKSKKMESSSKSVSNSLSSLPAPRLMSSSMSASNSISSLSAPRQKEKEEEKKGAVRKRSSESEDSEPDETDDPSEKIRNLIRFQKANGSFELEGLKLFAPNITEDTLKKKITISNTKVTDDIIFIFITAIVVALFEKNFPSQRVNWSLVVKKANIWIKKEAKKAGVPEDFDWKEAASNFLSDM